MFACVDIDIIAEQRSQSYPYTSTFQDLIFESIVCHPYSSHVAPFVVNYPFHALGAFLYEFILTKVR